MAKASLISPSANFTCSSNANLCSSQTNRIHFSKTSSDSNFGNYLFHSFSIDSNPLMSKQSRNVLSHCFHNEHIPIHFTSSASYKKKFSHTRNLNSFRIFASDAVVVSSTDAVVDSKSSSFIHHHQNKDRATWKAVIDFKWIKENKDLVSQNITERKSNADVELVLKVYEEFLQKNAEVEKYRSERNSVANAMKGKLDAHKRTHLVEEGKKIKDMLAILEVELEEISSILQREGQKIPNLTHPDAPRGGEEASFIRKMVGEKRNFDFPIKDHVDIALNLDLIDFDSAAEVTGSKFYYLKNEAVLLEMALVNWAISKLISKKFIPLTTPDLVRSDVLEKCGFQPRGQNTQVYSIEGSDLCLAGTSEILIGGLFMNKILNESDLPIRHVAFSHCFRTEAGASGAATRGLYRVHQFSKLEMFVVCTPEQSDQLHDELILIEEELYTSLGLHYKSLDMASEDLGSPAYRKFDIEAWMPGLGRYGEISSASNCTDYQSRRLNIRYRPVPAGASSAKKIKSQPTKFAHTLNATACAIPRMMVSILENFQQEDGSVIVPDVLRPYMGGLEVLKPKSEI